MVLKFDDIEYRTIADVKKQFKVSEKSLKKWVEEGHLPEPSVVAQGGRPFRHYTDEWCEKLDAYLKAKTNGKQS